MASSTRVTIEKKKEGDILWILVKGKFCKAYASHLKEQIESEISAEQKKILIEIDEFDSMNGFGIRFLYALDRKVQEFSGRLVVCVLNPTIREMLQVSGLSRSLIVVGSVEKGMEELR